MQRLETEVKLILPSFADYLKLIGCLGPIDEEVEQENGFYDSADHQLAEIGWALRVRAEKNKGLVTMKGSPQETASTGNAVSRPEIEEVIESSLAIDLLESRHQLMSLDIAPVSSVRKLFPDLKPVQYLRFRNLRRKKWRRFGDKDYLLEIDHTQFADGSYDYELEVELECPESIPELECYLRHLFGTLGVAYAQQPKSKLERALDKTAT